nr:MauE/DoxX family redox-associated membrane protein [Flavivirga eckloniae]
MLYILLFVYAAVSKLLVFDEFKIQIGQSPVLTAYAGWVVWIVPSVEILISLMLVIPRFRLPALYAAFMLMVMFTSYIFIVLNFSDFIPCSCGGVLEKLNWTEHLVFNIIFVVLAFIGVIILSPQKNDDNPKYVIKSLMPHKKPYALLFICMVCGVGLMFLLFSLSEHKIHRDNSFTRLFAGHPAIKSKELDLAYNSYYIAGADQGKIYLGNSISPFHLITLDTTLQNKETIRLTLDQDSLPYKSMQLRVIPPHFFLMDGVKSYIFRGNTTDWKASSVINKPVYFSQVEPIDSVSLLIRGVSSETRENVLGKVNLLESGKIDLTHDLLQKQIDGIFDTDGSLQYNRQLQKLVYTYYYRNQFIVADTNLQLSHLGKTIDTISHAQIEVGTIASKDQLKMAAPPLIVNRSSTTYGDYLFVNSKLIGKNEPKHIWKRASIIDVYNLVDNTYEFSFYVYGIKKDKLRSFRVLHDKFIGLVGNHIVTYQLNTNLFKNLLPDSKENVDPKI